MVLFSNIEKRMKNTGNKVTKATTYKITQIFRKEAVPGPASTAQMRCL